MAIGTGLALLGAAGAGLVGAGVNAYASNKAAETQADAAASAANTQAAASQQGLQFQREMFEQGRQDMAPYRQAGQQAVGQLQGLMTPQGQAQAFDAISQGPVFQQQTQQAEEALLRNASATGGLRTGQANVALSRIAPQIQQGLYSQQMQGLQGLAGMGAGIAGQGAGYAQSAGAGMANSAMQGGMAQAQGYQQAGNAYAQNTMNQAGNFGNLLGDLSGLGMYSAFNQGPVV